jgi:hypothetical protein
VLLVEETGVPRENHRPPVVCWRYAHIQKFRKSNYFKIIVKETRSDNQEWMDNPEKLATLGTQNEDKQKKNKHNTIYVGHKII